MVNGQHHCSSTALMHIMARLRSVLFHRPFRAFVRLNGGVPPHIPRHSETRYASIDTLAKVMVEHRGFIILFLYRCRSLLTQHDLDALKVLLNAENLEIIRLRALFASRLLLPVMKMANHTRGMLAFKQEMETVTSHVRAIAANPDLLSTLSIAPKDQAVQEQLTATMDSIVKVSKGTSSVQEGAGRERDVIEMVGATQAQIEREDGEIGEEQEEEVVLLQGRVTPSTLDLSAPSEKRIPTPEMAGETFESGPRHGKVLPLPPREAQQDPVPLPHLLHGHQPKSGEVFCNCQVLPREEQRDQNRHPRRPPLPPRL